MSSFETAKTRPTLSQVVALSMTYRLMFKVLQAPVVALLLLPVALRLCYFIFDGLTNKHTILSLTITMALTSSVRRLIHQAAPNEASAQEALTKSQVVLPCLVFTATCLFTNYFITPLEASLGARAFLTWSPTLTFSLALRAAGLAFLLGLSVLLRYIGPPSVMRCSSSPLMEHPFEAALHNLLSNLSVDAIRDLLTAPNDMPGQMIMTPFDYRGHARRLKSPMWISMGCQVIISTVLSSMVAFVSILPLFSSSRIRGETPLKVSIILACIVATLVQLLQSALDFKKHELDPFRHQSHPSMSSARLLMRVTASSLVIPSLLVLGCAVLARKYYFDEFDDEAAAADGLWAITAWSLITGSLIYLYLETFDEIVRHLLCTYSRSMRKVVEETADDNSADTFLDVIMCSLLHSNVSLVTEVGAPSNPMYHHLEREELRRSESAIKAMATTLLTKSHIEESSARLEEDVLRLALLSSLGGGSSVDNASAAVEQNVKFWIQSEKSPAMTISKGEPAVVPLVRALCTYFGGLGEAINICAAQKGSTKFNPWSLPPGAIACATYAVQAASRLIVLNLTVSTKILADWRSTHLSMLIPVFLTCAQHLESAMIKFVQAGLRDAVATDHMSILELLNRESPDLLPLYQAIFSSSLLILEKLKSLDGFRQVHFSVSPDCSRWIESLVTKISSDGHPQITPRPGVPLIRSY